MIIIRTLKREFMKTIIFSILFLLVTLKCYPEQYYVYIDKIGYVAEGEEAGHTAYGDVVGISPYTSQYKPTRAELSRYKIMVMDLTQEEMTELLESEYDKDPEIYDDARVIRARKRKIDISKLSNIKQEEVVSDKAKVFNHISVKPTFVFTP